MSDSISDHLKRARTALSRHLYQQALNEAEVALADLEQESPDTDLQGFAYELAGEAAAGLGDYALAEEYINHALARMDDPRELRRTLGCQLTLATCRLRHGELHQARYLADRVREQAAIEQWPELGARALIQLGNVCWLEGDLPRAIENLEEAVRICDEASFSRPANQARSSLGIALSMAGRMAEAEKMFRTALDFFQQESDSTQVVRCLNNLAGIAFGRHEWNRAREYLLDCVKLETEAHNRADLALSWFNLGLIEQRQGNWKLARKYVNRSLQLAREVGDRVTEASSLLQLGIVALMSDQASEAANYLELAQTCLEGSSSSTARVLPYYAALCHLAGGKLEHARELWNTRPPWPESENVEQVLEVLRHMLTVDPQEPKGLTEAAHQQAGEWLQEIIVIANDTADK